MNFDQVYPHMRTDCDSFAWQVFVRGHVHVPVPKPHSTQFLHNWYAVQYYELTRA